MSWAPSSLFGAHFVSVRGVSCFPLWVSDTFHSGVSSLAWLAKCPASAVGFRWKNAILSSYFRRRRAGHRCRGFRRLIHRWISCYRASFDQGILAFVLSWSLECILLFFAFSAVAIDQLVLAQRFQFLPCHGLTTSLAKIPGKTQNIPVKQTCSVQQAQNTFYQFQIRICYFQSWLNEHHNNILLACYWCTHVSLPAMGDVSRKILIKLNRDTNTAFAPTNFSLVSIIYGGKNWLPRSN